MYRILVIGTGSIGERHLRCFQNTGRAELSICETNADLRKTIADRYNIQQAFASLDTALEHTFHAAVVAVPAHLHIPISTRLAEAGIHLLIEKPLSTSLDGVESLRKIIAKKRLTAAIGYVHRANPALSTMREAIHSGRFGEPVQLFATVGQHFPTYRPAYREIYFANRTTGGGAIQDGLTHILNMGEWLAGPISHLVADAAHQVLDGIEVEDTVHVLTRHGTVMGSYVHNLHQAPNETTVTVACKNGTARLDIHLNQWRWMIEPGNEWHIESFEIPERDTLFTRQANAFLDALETKAAPLCSLEEAIQTLQVNLATLKSADDSKSLIPVSATCD
ncbi:MAG: Gfo/Idh/MocA family oxidoreductase [bacterium]|nr:Gfo/Idh/MocA family oxidoreductase [bacterium]